MSTPNMRLGVVENLIHRATIFQQFSGQITDVLSPTSIKVLGDATAFFADGDIILCPLKNFVTELTISGTPSFASGKTTIDVDSGSFAAEDVGLTVCLKIVITDKVLENGFGAIITKLEGVSLNSFDSGETKISLSNTDGYFYHHDGTGILQTGDIFWYQYHISYKYAPDEFLVFGGIIDLTEVDADLINHVIKLNIFGHTKELERYPAFYLNNASAVDLIKIPGFSLYQYTNNENSEEGVKPLRFEPFASGEMDGITIDSVSNDTPIGIHVLEFRYPNEFRWSNGAWTVVASTADYTIADQGLVKIYALDGSGDSLYAMVKFGDRDSLNPYPDSDSEIWVGVSTKNASKVARAITGVGKPKMQFDNGVETQIKLHFPRVLLYEDGGGTYTDISENTNTYYLDNFLDVLTADDDALYIFASEPFYGIDVLFEEGIGFTTADLTFQYSNGGIVFSAAMDFNNNGLVDGTNNLTENGQIRWTTVPGWHVGQVIISTTEAYFGYIIKITRNSATGTCSLQEIKRLLRLIGNGGDILDLQMFQEKLAPVDTDDNVIITNINDSWQVKVWHQNVSLHKLLTRALDVSNYPAANRVIEDMSVTLAEPTFNIWGKSPKLNYPFLPTAVYVDAASQYLYLACELELWRCSFTGEWEFLTRVIPAGSLNNIWITDIKKVDDTIYLFAWWQYVVDDNAAGKSFAYFFSYDLVSGLTTDLLPDQPGFYDGTICLRPGTLVSNMVGFDLNYYRIFGQNIIGLGAANGDYGENLCIPFRQPVHAWNAANNNPLRAADNIDEKTGDGYPNWYFDTDYVGYLGEERSGPFYFADHGYYQVSDDSGDLTEPGEIGLAFSYNQQGSYFWDSDENNMYGNLLLTDSHGGSYIGLKGIGSTNRTKYGNLRTYDIEMFFPYCSSLNLDDGLIYLGRTAWYDLGDDSKSYSYITKFHNTKANNWDKAFVYDDSGTSYTDITDDLNDGTPISGAFDEVDDAVYLGYAKKFRAATFALDNADNGYRIEYWDGASWTECPYTAQAGADEDFADSLITFTIPHDWDTNAIVGDTEYWIRVRCNSFTSTTEVTTAQLVEYAMWDSEIDNSADYQRTMPIALCYNPDELSLHVSLFNRESDSISDSNPFQWRYGVLDLQYEVLYFATSGDNFTLNGSYTPKHLIYNATDNQIYFMMESARYKDNDAFLVTAVYDPGDNSITLTSLGTPKIGEWGSLVKIQISDDGFVYGVTNGTKYSLWEFANEFFPRIELADFGDRDSIREVLSYIAQIKNCTLTISPSKVLTFLSRGEFNNTLTVDWNVNMINHPVQITNWDHYYDSIAVNWKNGIDGSAGVKKFGTTGWGKRTLTIDNPLLQSPYVAAYIGQILYDYYTIYRQNIKKLRVIPTTDFNLLDKVNVVIPPEILNIDGSIYYFISAITYNLENLFVELEGIEI